MREPIHDHPEECLKTLKFCKGDGGRANYMALTKQVIGPRHGDCAVIAVVYATGMEYFTALESLNGYSSYLGVWETRWNHETLLRYIWRRLKQIATDIAPFYYAIHRDPLYGTSSIAYGCLLVNAHDYRLVFGPPDTEQSYCICSQDGDFVVDGSVPGEGTHAAAIINGIVQGDVDITGNNFDVSNVWHRSPEDRNRTTLRWLR